MVNVAPEMSAGCSLFARARSDSSLRCFAIPPSGSLSALRIDGRHHGVLHGHRKRHVDVGVQRHGIVHPAAVHSRELLERPGHGGDHQVGVGDLHAVRFLDDRNQPFANRVERCGIDVTGDEEMRDRRPALRRPLGHDAADGADGIRRPGRRWRRRRGRTGGRRWSVVEVPAAGVGADRVPVRLRPARPSGCRPRGSRLQDRIPSASRCRRRARARAAVPSVRSSRPQPTPARAPRERLRPPAAAGAESIFRPVCACEPPAGRDSPGLSSQAIVCPTGTTSPTFAVTPDSTPSPAASISTTALSVSTSSSISPLLTCSPSFFFHETSLPVSCAISSAGITTLIGH